MATFDGHHLEAAGVACRTKQNCIWRVAGVLKGRELQVYSDDTLVHSVHIPHSAVFNGFDGALNIGRNPQVQFFDLRFVVFCQILTSYCLCTHSGLNVDVQS